MPITATTLTRAAGLAAVASGLRRGRRCLTMTIGPSAQRLCELRVQGHLDPSWSEWFGGLTLIHHRDGTSTLRGGVTDQSHLYGLLLKVRDLGLTLLSMRILAGWTSSAPSASDPRPPGRGPVGLPHSRA